MQPQDVAAKRSFIEAYFDDAQKSVAKLAVLAGAGYHDEAVVLCLVYIDRAAQKLFWPSGQTGANFVCALSEFGQDPEFSQVHPKQIVAALRKMQVSGTRSLRSLSRCILVPHISCIRLRASKRRFQGC